MADINCSEPTHAGNSGYPGWVTIIGSTTGSPPTGMICPGCVAALADESLADAQARCIGNCRTFCDVQNEAATVEHPGASTKFWATTKDFQQYVNMLVTNDAGATTLRTADGLQSHAFADTPALAALLTALCSGVCTEEASRDTAETNIVAAADIPAVEAARDVYTEA